MFLMQKCYCVQYCIGLSLNGIVSSVSLCTVLTVCAKRTQYLIGASFSSHVEIEVNDFRIYIVISI